MMSPLYFVAGVAQLAGREGSLPASRARARDTSRRAGSCSPRTTRRTSILGRWGSRSCLGASCASWRRRSSSTRSWPRSCARAARSRCAAARGTSRRCARPSSSSREGEIVVMFPEGTRQKKGLRKKHEARPHTGAARIALTAGVAARAGRDRRHRPAQPARAAAGRLRRADRRSPTSKAWTTKTRGDDRDRAADGGDRRAEGDAVKPLLVIDGDSLAHRAYHAMPKSIRLNGVLGFANMVTRLWEAEQPRAVLVGWDTYEVPTYRHKEFEPYQSGRVFEESLLEQLTADGAARRGDGLREREGAAATRPTTSSAPRSPSRSSAAARRSSRPPTATSFQLASERTTILQPVRGVSELARIGPAEVRRALRRRAGAGARLHRAARRPLRQAPGRARASGRRRPPTCCASTARSRPRSRPAASRRRRRIFGSTGELRPWTPLPRSLPSKTRHPTWAEASSLVERLGPERPRRAAGKVGADGRWLEARRATPAAAPRARTRRSRTHPESHAERPAAVAAATRFDATWSTDRAGCRLHPT